MALRASKMGEFIRTELGRTSAQLVKSFQKYCDENIPADSISSTQSWWTRLYPDWIKTVKQNPNYKVKTPKTLDLAKLYLAFGRLEEKLKESEEKHKVKDDIIKSLREQIKRLENGAIRYVPPPANVLRAMAIHGD